MNILVTSSACEQIAKANIAATQGWEYRAFNDFRGIAEYEADLIIFLGWYVPDMKDWWQHKLRIGKTPKVVVLWAGTDILQVKQFYLSGGKQMFKDFKGDQFCHIPEDEFQKDELLKGFGLESADPLPSPVSRLFEEMPQPENFTVGVYSPTARYDFYRLYDIAAALKQAECRGIFYHFLFDYAKLKLEANQEGRFAITRTEYEQVIADCSCAVRVPVHDGLSLGAAEFLMAGRPVISCHDMPRWPRLIRGTEVTPEKIAKAIRAIRDGSRVPSGVQQYYRDLFDPAKYGGRLQERLRTKWGDLSLAG